MNTKIYDVTRENILNCSKDIKNGKLVIFPTETVYGIGANAFDKNACENIFKAKNRPADNPLIVHISDLNMLNDITKNISDIENRLIKEFFPGPFTLILNKNDNIPNIVTAGLDTVAVRMPKDETANLLIKYSNVPIAAPSANISSKPSGTNPNDIINELNGRVDTILKGNSSKIGIESTVARVIDNVVVILRPGYITKDDIINKGFNCKYDDNILKSLNKNDEILSPGMKYKHYSPNTKCILLKCDNNKLNESINKVITEYNISKDKVCILTYDEFLNDINFKKISLGSYNNYNEISENLYSKLREIDNLDLKLCIIHSLEENDRTIAILNRIIKTCNHTIYKF